MKKEGSSKERCRDERSTEKRKKQENRQRSKGEKERTLEKTIEWRGAKS